MTLTTKTYPTLEALREAFERLLDTPTFLFWPTQELFDRLAIKNSHNSANVCMSVTDNFRIHHDVEKPTPIATIGYWAAIG